jgi:hypothetical protein
MSLGTVLYDKGAMAMSNGHEGWDIGDLTIKMHDDDHLHGRSFAQSDLKPLGIHQEVAGRDIDEYGLCSHESDRSDGSHGGV